MGTLETFSIELRTHKHLYFAILCVSAFIIFQTFLINNQYCEEVTHKSNFYYSIILCIALSAIDIVLIIGRIWATLPGRYAMGDHGRIVNSLRNYTFINNHLDQVVRDMRSRGRRPTEREMIINTRSVMTIVANERCNVPILQVLGIIIAALAIVFLYALVSINLTYLLGNQAFYGVDMNTKFIQHFCYAMEITFLIGYSNVYPIHSLTSLLSVVEIISGISLMIVGLNALLSAAFQEISESEEAIREHLLLETLR